MATRTASNETQSVGLRVFRAVSDAPSALDTVVVAEGIADLRNAAAHGNILDGPRVRRLGHEKFGDIPPQFFDFFRVAADHHPFLGNQGTGGGYFPPAFDDMFNNAKPAGAGVFQNRNIT
jgi:hypothetical protein